MPASARPTANRSVENQLLELRRFAASQGWSIFQEYIDHESGKSASRLSAKMTTTGLQCQIARVFIPAGRPSCEELSLADRREAEQVPEM